MGRSRFAAILIAVLVALSVLTPAFALGATTKAPEAGGSIDLQAWAESGQLIIVTAVALPDSVKLPATVRIPVPEGATVQWAGEVFGGDLSADIERPYKMIKSPVGGQYAEFTLEQTRTAQVDSDMAAVTEDGAGMSASFEWVQSVASPGTSFSVRVPARATAVKVVPAPAGAPDTNAAGEHLYSGDEIKLEPGQKQTVSFNYSTAAAGQGDAPASSLNSLVTILAIALAVAILILVVLVVRQRGARIVVEEPAGKRDARTGPRAATSKSEAGPASDDDWGFDDTQ